MDDFAAGLVELEPFGTGLGDRFDAGVFELLPECGDLHVELGSFLPVPDAEEVQALERYDCCHLVALMV